MGYTAGMQNVRIKESLHRESKSGRPSLQRSYYTDCATQHARKIKLEWRNTKATNSVMSTILCHCHMGTHLLLLSLFRHSYMFRQFSTIVGLNTTQRSEVNNAWQTYTLRGTPQIYKEYYITKLYKIVKIVKQTDSRLAGGCKIACLAGCVELQH